MKRPRPWSRDFIAPTVLGVLHLALHLTLQLRPGVTAVVLWYVGPPALAVLGLALLLHVLASSIKHRMTLDWRRGARLVALAGLAAAPALYRTYPSSHDTHASAVRFALPLSGPVTVVWGGKTSAANAHVVAPDQRWGYDLIVTVSGMSFRGDGTRATDYYAYGREILAPADGIVRTIHDAEPDAPIGRKGRGDDLGNHIAIEVGSQEFLYIAHLQPGSITVKSGDRVASGQILGRVGNSGTSSEPHVHLHLQDSARRHFAEGIPFYFFAYCNDDAFVDRGMPKGGRAGDRWIGEIVTPAADRDCAEGRLAGGPSSNGADHHGVE